MAPQDTRASRSSAIFRSAAAFSLNLMAAIIGPLSLGQGAMRLMYVHLPSISLAERQLFISIVFAALAAFCVTRFWSTTTAKWVWIVPLPFLLFRMVMYTFVPHRDSVMQDLGAN